MLTKPTDGSSRPHVAGDDKNRELAHPAPRGLARLRGLHRDERGTISIVTVVALMMFTLTMGMVINVGRHVDDKVKQQNAVDAATYSGGVMLTRGMNSLAFSNHLLCDVFALTAFMREGRDRNAENLSKDVLDAWDKVGPMFAKSPYEKFKGLGQGISPKVQAEREMVRTFSDFVAAISDLTLPTLEQVLQQKLIPQFERSLVQTVPAIAQQTMTEISRRHSTKPVSDLNSRGPTWGVLWRTNVQPSGLNEQDPTQRTLPAVDPDPSQSDYPSLEQADQYTQVAFKEREELSRTYLGHWNDHILSLFPKYAQMSQFYQLWRTFTHGQLCKLQYEEYPTSNLPFQIRRMQGGTEPESIRSTTAGQIAGRDFVPPPNQPFINQYLERNYRFVGVCYRQPLNEMFGKLFKNKLQASTMTFSEIALFLPEPRKHHVVAAGGQAPPQGAGGGSQFFGPNLPQDPERKEQNVSQPVDTYFTENWPRNWSLLSQNWTVQLVPATAENVVQILQTQPQQFSQAVTVDQNIVVPNFGGLQAREFRMLNHH